MIDITQLQFEKLHLKGLQELIKLATLEGWNPGINDAEIFWKTDPNGFYGYYYNGELIAGGAIVSYNNEFGFMGLFIVKQAYRSLGIGRKIWHERKKLLISRLHKNATIVMDGVVAMQPFYEKGGFKIAFRDVRYEIIGKPHEVHQNVTEIKTTDFNKVLAYDKECFGFSRPQFMIPWLEQSSSKSFLYTEKGNLKGFVVLRKVQNGYKIGPLFADTKEIAEALYKSSLNHAINSSVYLDIPMTNKNAIDMVTNFGAKYVFECARMYHNSAPKVSTNKIFGITTFELG